MYRGRRREKISPSGVRKLLGDYPSKATKDIFLYVGYLL